MKVIIHSRFIDVNSSGECESEYFFSTDHCQGIKDKSVHKDFVPTTFHLPMSVTPRPSLPSGRIETVKDLIMIFHSKDREIPNPNPAYQVSYL